MDKLNFNQTGGFPLSTNILDAMQTAYSLFNQLGNLAGNYAIISGCEKTGNNIANGVVYINGEVLEFKGGAISTNVIIRDEADSRIFEDGSTKQVVHTRYATFGSSTPDKTYAWANFKPVFPTTEIADFKKSLEDRIKALEDKKSPIPLGLIAIWGKPASEPIPEGWQEYTELRGRMAVGHDPDYLYDDDNFSKDYDPEDYKLNQIGAEGGKRYHNLTENEMPRHSHNYHKAKYNYGHKDGATDWTRYGREQGDASDPTTFVGNDQAHNNMPPYRVIRYIQFVGF